MKQVIGYCVLYSLSGWAMNPPPNAIVDMGEVEFSGNGCDSLGDVKILSQAKGLFEITFDGFVIENEYSRQKRYDHKICRISIPLTVSNNKSVAVSKITYSGFNDFEDGSLSKFTTEAYFAGKRAPKIQKVYSESGEFRVDTILSESEKSWSRCDEASLLHLIIEGEIIDNEESTNSVSMLDGRITFQVDIKPC